MKKKLIIYLLLYCGNCQLKAQNSFNDLEKALQNIDKVEILNLSNLSLTQFPLEIIKFKNLHTLNISQNELEDLPMEISQLTKLKILDVSSNHFQSFPKVIFELRQLEDLNLTGKYRIEEDKILIQNIPNEISQLTNLKILNLSKQGIELLPQSIQQLNKLESLYLYGNQLDISSVIHISGLINLKILDLSANDIEELPLSFVDLQNLHTLYIDNRYGEGVPVGKQLKTFPAVLCKLKNLKTLSLSGMQFEALKVDFSQLQNLTYLDLYNNYFRKFPKALLALKSLEALNLGVYPVGEYGVIAQKLFIIPQSICQLTNLKYFLLDQRNISQKNIDKIKSCLPLITFE